MGILKVRRQTWASLDLAERNSPRWTWYDGKMDARFCKRERIESAAAKRCPYTPAHRQRSVWITGWEYEWRRIRDDAPLLEVR